MKDSRFLVFFLSVMLLLSSVASIVERSMRKADAAAVGEKGSRMDAASLAREFGTEHDGQSRPGFLLRSVRQGRGGASLEVDFFWYPSADDLVMVNREWQGNEYPIGRVVNGGAVTVEVRGARVFRRGGLPASLDCNGWTVPVELRDRIIDAAQANWEALQ